MVDYSVLAIVVTYNGQRWIDKCLKSLLNSSMPVDILVIDNGSSDGTREYIESSFPNVRLIKSEVNLFFGQGNNVGLKIALSESYDYVFLLNQDAWVQNDTLALLVQAHKANKDFGVLSSTHLNGTGTSLETKFGEYINVYDCPELVSDKYLNRPLSEVYQINFVNAAAWLISHECLQNVGGFDPLFQHYGEDEDYIRRVHFKNFKVGIVPNAYIYHDSDFKSWDKIKTNINRLLIMNLLELKKVGVPYRSSFLSFLKSSLDRGGSYLLFRKWTDLRCWFLSIVKTIKYLNKIPSSLNESYKTSSFLN